MRNPGKSKVAIRLAVTLNAVLHLDENGNQLVRRHSGDGLGLVGAVRTGGPSVTDDGGVVASTAHSIALVHQDQLQLRIELRIISAAAQVSRVRLGPPNVPWATV